MLKFSAETLFKLELSSLVVRPQIFPVHSHRDKIKFEKDISFGYLLAKLFKLLRRM